jgi:hypothetical protein
MIEMIKDLLAGILVMVVCFGSAYMGLVLAAAPGKISDVFPSVCILILSLVLGRAARGRL